MSGIQSPGKGPAKVRFGDIWILGAFDWTSYVYVNARVMASS
jgi:hypothetical protein